MSAVVGHGEELHIPRENCHAVPFVVDSYGWRAVRMPLVLQVSSLLLWSIPKTKYLSHNAQEFGVRAEFVDLKERGASAYC